MQEGGQEGRGGGGTEGSRDFWPALEMDPSPLDVGVIPFKLATGFLKDC
jgi:hypothetical protein